jgi:regulator of replication initiation timing
MKIHNIKPGEIKHCQICGNKKIKTILNLGSQPLADDLRSIYKKVSKTFNYPIIIGFCNKCTLLQNNFIVDEKKLYKKNYHYRPGITKDVLKNFKFMSNKLKNLYNLNSSSVVVDIGCNDGSLLNEFKKNKIKNIIGIDPTNTIEIAKKNGAMTIQSFMNVRTSKKAKKFFGEADLITTTNVFAHTNKLEDFILGVKDLIKDNGIFVIENHYLKDVVAKKQFDTFYHEHLRTYSLKSLIKLMKMYDFKVVDAYTSDRYGGNIQAHFSLKIKNKTNRVKSILAKEKMLSLHKNKTYFKFQSQVDDIKDKLAKYLDDNKHKKIVAKAFPARASILLHHFSSIKKHIKYIAEQPTSLKLNKYAPGTNIKIVSSSIMKKNKPDIIIILAWHLFDTIYYKWNKIFKGKVKFIKILPRLEIK